MSKKIEINLLKRFAAGGFRVYSINLLKRFAAGGFRVYSINLLKRFAAGGFRVYSINHRPGLSTDTTMVDLAADYASAIRQRFDKPVDVFGFSTGGAIAFNLAAGYPELVCRLVLASAAHRMGPVAWEACRRAAERAELHDIRGFQSAMGPTAAHSKWVQRAAGAFGWLLAPFVLGPNWNPSDAVITLRADMTIDVESRLSNIQAPMLLISGEWDPSYPPEIIDDLAARIPNVRQIRYPRTGHGVVIKQQFSSDLARYLKTDTAGCA